MNLSHLSFPRRGGGVMIRVMRASWRPPFCSPSPQAARADSFLSTVPDQTFTVGTAVSVTLPKIDWKAMFPIGNCFGDWT